MRPSKHFLLALGLTIGLGGFCASAVETVYRTGASFRQNATEYAAPTLKAYSREKVVDVTVTDAKGQPVHGLKQADFTVKEDGKEQAIRSFEEFGSAAQAVATQALPKLPPNIYTNLQPPLSSSAVNILLLDFINSAPDTDRMPTPDDIPILGLRQAFGIQHLIREEAVKYLHSMPAGTRVAVIGMEWPDRLRILQGVTSDPALLSAAVNTMPPAIDLPPKIPMTAESLNQIAAAAAQIKGRKNLIWFTYGLQPTCTRAAVASPILQAIHTLAEAQITVYPIGVRGVYYQSPQYAVCQGAQMLRYEQVAEAGGGIAYYNSNDLETGIARAIENGSHYYTLTYVPPGTQYDGRHHTIHVNLNLTPERHGLHLTYRDEYYAEDPAKMLPATRLSLLTTPDESNPGNMRVAMSRSMPTSQQLLFDIQVEPSTEAAKAGDPPIFGALDPKLKDKKLARYGFQYALPGSQIAFADAANGARHGSIEFDIAAYDAEGKLVNSLSQSINLPLSSGQAQQLAQSPFRFFQQLDLPPGQIFLRVGVLDRTSNKVGTLEIPLTVPKNSAQRAANSTK